MFLRRRIGCLAACAATAFSATAAICAAPTRTITDIDLSRPFATARPWRLVATQGPPMLDPGDDMAPGEIQLCLRAGPAAPCDPALRNELRAKPLGDVFDRPHYLESVKIVRPRRPGAGPLLLVRTASQHSGDGDQVVQLQALAYRPGTGTFVRVYDHTTGHNNNQAIRYLEAGPLAGDIVSVDPTSNAPFGFWVVVSAPSPQGPYRQVLRYRSATRYHDGDRLAVIGSEMPDIERRLGVWRPGAPLPTPSDGPCPRPHLVHAELWCD